MLPLFKCLATFFLCVFFSILFINFVFSSLGVLFLHLDGNCRFFFNKPVLIDQTLTPLPFPLLTNRLCHRGSLLPVFYFLYVIMLDSFVFNLFSSTFSLFPYLLCFDHRIVVPVLCEWGWLWVGFCRSFG